MANPVRVMGIDTSLRSTGYGIIDAAGSASVPVAYGRIKNAQGTPLSACLLHLREEVARLIAEHHPDVVSIEKVIYARNAKTAMILAHARGAVISQCAAGGIPIYEYEPRRVKSAVVGVGLAEKEQVQRMVKAMLGLAEIPQNDAADALALAITHVHNRTGLVALQSAEPI